MLSFGETTHQPTLWGVEIMITCTSTSLVVIGRNSLDSLQAIYTPDYCRQLKLYFAEFHFVDSDSTDGSAEFMATIGFTIHRLGGAGVLNAAAGRWLGTIRNECPYLLYLDSDMELDNPALIPGLVQDLKGSLFSGLVGEVVDVTPDGKTRTRIRKTRRSGEAFSFGGFLLVEKEAILRAGNWNPDLHANEELDLHCRLRRQGSKIGHVAGLRVWHRTGWGSTPLNELGALYLPWRSPLRYGAFGRVLAASLRQGHVPVLVNLFPEPFLLLLVLLAAVLGLGPWPVALLFLIYEAVLLSRRSWKFNAVVPGVLLSLPYGLFTYRPRFLEVK